MDGDEALLSLRAEYVALCARNGASPSVGRTTDEALRALAPLVAGPDDDVRARYARTVFPILEPGRELLSARPSFYRHPLSLVANGARVHGYVEMVLEGCRRLERKFSVPVYVDELPIDSFNGRMFPSESSAGYFCMLDHGLFRLLTHVSMAALLMTNVDISPNEERPYLTNPDLRISAVAVVKETMEAYLANQAHPLVMPASYWLDEGGIYGANGLSFAMKVFVVAHEFGHIQLAHFSKGHAPVTREEQWQREFEADQFAQEVLLVLHEAAVTSMPVLSGGLAFLLVDLIRQRVFGASRGIRRSILEKSGGHPPPLQRIKRLDDWLTQKSAASGEQLRQALTDVQLLQWIAVDLEG